MKNILTFLTDRAKERSTWLGLVGLVSAVGLSLAPEQKEAIISAGVALGGVIAAFTKDSPKK